MFEWVCGNGLLIVGCEVCVLKSGYCVDVVVLLCGLLGEVGLVVFFECK